MDYVEMQQPLRKPVLDTLLSSEALSRGVPYTGVNGGFRAMNIPMLPHAKPASMPPQPGTSTAGGALPEIARRAALQAYLPPQPLNGAHFHQVVKASPGGMNVAQLAKPGDLAAPLPVDAAPEKGKKTRDGGGRGSRGGGGSRKRSRTAQPVVEEGLPAGLVDCITPPARAGGGGRQRASSGDRVEKGSARKLSGQASRRGEKRASQLAATTAADALPKISAVNCGTNASRSGAFDIYGLKTKPVDISHYIADIPLAELIARSSQPNVSSSAVSGGMTKRSDGELPLDQHISSILAFLPPFHRQSATVVRRSSLEATSSKAGDSSIMATKSTGKIRPQRLLFDLESPVQADENDLIGRTVDASSERDTQGDQNMAPASEVSTGPSSQKAPAQSGRGFDISDLRLSSVKEFQARLKLSPAQSLESLTTQVFCDRESGLPAISTFASSYSRISLQPFSLPPMGSFKSEADFEKSPQKLGKIGHRPWIRCEPAGSDCWLQNGLCASGHLDLQELGIGDSLDKDPGSKGRATPPVLDSTQGHSGDNETSTAGRCMTTHAFGGPQGVSRLADSASPMEVEAGPSLAALPTEGEKVLAGPMGAETATNGHSDRLITDGDSKLLSSTPSGVADCAGGANLRNKQQDVDVSLAEHKLGGEQAAAADSPLVDAELNLKAPAEPEEAPWSPSAIEAAWTLVQMSASTEPYEIPASVSSKRRVFEPYPGAPTQRAAKSMKIGNLGGGIAGASALSQGEGRDSLDGGNVPPNKALVSEKRKSLSQVTEVSPSVGKSIPSRGNACGLRGSVGSAGRVNGWAKPDKSGSTVNKESGRAPGPSRAVKGAPRSALCSSQQKGAAAAKAPGAGQRVGGSKSSRAPLSAMSPHSLAAVSGAQPNPAKSNRQSVPFSSEGKPKTKGRAIKD